MQIEGSKQSCDDHHATSMIEWIRAKSIISVSVCHNLLTAKANEALTMIVVWYDLSKIGYMWLT